MKNRTNQRKGEKVEQDSGNQQIQEDSGDQQLEDKMNPESPTKQFPQHRIEITEEIESTEHPEHPVQQPSSSTPQRHLEHHFQEDAENVLSKQTMMMQTTPSLKEKPKKMFHSF